MKRFLVYSILLILFILLTGCGLGNGDIYITVDNNGGPLLTVKFVEPWAGTAGYDNVVNSYSSTVEYGGYTWYVYSVPGGSYDVYIEWYDYLGDWANGRGYGASITPGSDLNEWAAVYPESDTNNTHVEEGGGSFAPTLVHM